MACLAACAALLCAVLLPGNNASMDRGHQLVAMQQKSDPLASAPWDNNLSPRELKHLYYLADHEAGEGSHPAEDFRAPTLSKPRIDMAVQVVLVGFDGTGRLSLPGARDALQKRLAALHLPGAIEVVSQAEPLATTARYTFHTTQASTALAAKLSGALTFALNANAKPGRDGVTPASLLPSSIIDNVLAQDMADSRRGGPVVYLLDLKMPGGLYAYVEAKSRQRCARAFWAGQEPYLWADVHAGPVSFGPQEGSEGEGQEWFSMLHTRTTSGLPTHMVLSQLASFVASATRQLILPPLHHVMKDPVPNLHIQVIHIYDIPPFEANYDYLLPAYKQELEKVLLPGQAVELTVKPVLLAECDVCVTALTAARRTAVQVQPASDHVLVEHDYLSSVHMHEILQTGPGKSAAFRAAGLALDVPSATRRVLPVYVYHLSQIHPLLFDDARQAVAFQDSVLVLETTAGHIASHVSCSGKPQLLLSTQVEQPLKEAILLAGWGVTPHALSRTGMAALTRVNVTQRLADLSDGPFSFGSMSWENGPLNFVQATSARRNAALSAIEHAYRAAEEVFEGIAKLAEYDRRYSKRDAEHAWLRNTTANAGWAEAVSAALYERAGGYKAPHARGLSPVTDAQRAAAFQHRMHHVANLLRASDGGAKTLRYLRVLRFKILHACKELSAQQYHAATWYALSSRHEVAKIRKFASDYTWHTKLEVVCGSTHNYRTGLIRLLAVCGPPSVVWLLMQGRRRQRHVKHAAYRQ